MGPDLLLKELVVHLQVTGVRLQRLHRREKYIIQNVSKLMFPIILTDHECSTNAVIPEVFVTCDLDPLHDIIGDSLALDTLFSTTFFCQVL